MQTQQGDLADASSELGRISAREAHAGSVGVGIFRVVGDLHVGFVLRMLIEQIEQDVDELWLALVRGRGLIMDHGKEKQRKRAN